MSRTELLEDTARLVEGVAEDLDTHETPCCTCGLKVARNWGERQAHIELSTCASKLRKIAQKIKAAKTARGDRDENEATD